ncbi:response regulator, partial [Serratia ficaria]|uniref:response regulator n=1 Tax=Serratia ficaria TaxID=61651 RepID=UPI0021B82FC7
MPSLLLVDDHPVVHVALEAALMKSSRPYTLQAAQDDAQALAQLAAGAFSLVILDIGLPQVDGLQLLKKIRRRYPQQPILIYTAQEEDIYARMAHPPCQDSCRLELKNFRGPETTKMNTYSPERKAALIARMMPPHNQSVVQLA